MRRPHRRALPPAFLRHPFCFPTGSLSLSPFITVSTARRRRRRQRRRSMALNTSSNVRAKRIKREGNRISLDITNEILLRLPVRSLIRFRCVCKLWHSITYDPQFINAHLELARRIPAVLFCPAYHNKTDALGISYLEDDEDSTTLSPPKPYCQRPRPDGRQSSIQLKGSCNGLLCITGEAGSVLLLNPSTREFVTTPEPTKSSLPSKVYLGFHPVTKEYKVLRFFGRWPLYQNLKRKGCEVYTLGTSLWRQICTPLEYMPAGRGATTKGAMYWKALGVEDSLLCFDLRDERFTWTSLPNFKQVYPGKETTIAHDLVELQGGICVPVFPEVPQYVGMEVHQVVPQMDIWMLINDVHHGRSISATTAVTTITPEWIRKYSLILPWMGHQPMPLLIRNENILMQYHQLKARGKRKLDVSLLQYHHLENIKKGGDKQSNESSKSNAIEVFYDCNCKFDSFLYVESLVQLRQP